MNKDDALALVRANLSNINLRKHSWAAGAVMHALAGKLGEDAGLWELTGLLHDLDYDSTSSQPDMHTLVTEKMLADTGLSSAVLHAIKAHNNKAPIETRLDLALYVTDPTTGFLIACALIRPEKSLASVTVEFALKRWKDKRFAAGADRAVMARCEELGMSRQDFLQISLDALKGISGKLEL